MDQFPTSMRAIDDLHNAADSMYWTSPEKKQAISEARSSMRSSEAMVKEAVALVGTMVLVNAIENNSQVEDSRKYVTCKLRTPVASLHSTVREKLAMYNRSASAKASGKAEVCAVPKRAESDVSTSVPSSQATSQASSSVSTAESQAQPPKKLRRLVAPG